jgi:hypothetical protein
VGVHIGHELRQAPFLRMYLESKGFAEVQVGVQVGV